MKKKREILGLIEEINILGNKKKKINAKIDSGATTSSIDIGLAAELRLGPLVMTNKVTSSHGSSRRVCIKFPIKIKGKIIESLFTLADRHGLKYPVLIGVNTLKKGKFLIDPMKK